jgi:glycosyltransferase involved in cell wall biosynthesis
MRAWNFTERLFGFPYPLWSPISLVHLWKAVRDSDIVHLHDSLYMGNVFAFLFARLLRKPVVITQHVGFIPYSQPFLQAILTLAQRLIAYPLLRYCDQSTFISEKVQDYFLRSVSFQRAPVFIPNGVATAVFHPVGALQRQCMRNELGLPGDKSLMLFVGRFVEKKGMLTLRSLATHFGNCEWIFIGWGPIAPDTWGLANVHCLGSMDRTHIVPYYQIADLFVLPSVGEGFPLVVQEAMACGTPVLISEDTADGMKNIKSVAFVSYPSLDHLMPVLTSILSSPAALEVRRQQVSAFAQQHWDWDICTDRYRQLFLELIH